MENLYKKLNDKIDLLQSFKDNLLDTYYYIYFIYDYIPNLMENAINNLKLQDIKDINSSRDIKIDLHIHFFENNINKLTMNIVGSDVLIYIPENIYEDLKNRIIDFFNKYELSTEITINKALNKNKGVVINSNLEMFASAYSSEVFEKGQIQNLFPTLRKIYELKENTLSLLNTQYADKVCYEIFEKVFLDDLVFNLIKRNIADLNEQNYLDKLSQKLEINKEISIGPNFNRENISTDELKTIFPIINDFMQDYNIGSISHLHNGIAVTFKTNIYDLLNAYYMEKQRLNSLIVVSKSEKTKVKSLKLHPIPPIEY